MVEQTARHLFAAGIKGFTEKLSIDTFACVAGVGPTRFTHRENLSGKCFGTHVAPGLAPGSKGVILSCRSGSLNRGIDRPHTVIVFTVAEVPAAPRRGWQQLNELTETQLRTGIYVSTHRLCHEHLFSVEPGALHEQPVNIYPICRPFADRVLPKRHHLGEECSQAQEATRASSTKVACITNNERCLIGMNLRFVGYAYLAKINEARLAKWPHDVNQTPGWVFYEGLAHPVARPGWAVHRSMK